MTRSKLFDFVLNFLEDEGFISQHKTQSKYFTRDRIWTFKTAFLFISSFINERTQSSADKFFSEMYNVPSEIRQITASAFSQCRDKINYTAFQYIFERVVKYFYSGFDFETYHGLRLIAIDGSVFTLPKTRETIKEFGENVLSKKGKWIKAKVSFATDVLNNICVDAIIGRYKENEMQQAEYMFDNLGKNNLLLFDRGYFSRDFFKSVCLTENHFCFRLQSHASKMIMDFIASTENDIVTEITIDDENFKVRLTKILLDSGEMEYLATSLVDMLKFPKSELKSLYNQRWGVEEQFKDVKYALCIENFVGKKTNSIRQEFYANILSYNMAMMTCKPEIDERSNRKAKKLKYKCNKRALLSKLKQCIVKIYLDIDNRFEVLCNIILSVSKESVPIRPNRKFERNITYKAKVKPNNVYISVV
ncbi:IS4 family transposase [Ancylomarina sp. 16SWW S1-10-2]|uniref:IS4 family transposase n=1 Tax=Ancylomarina sp. 16SWW S1-10-2 TaxID=2499681 RepID=UPI0012AE917A|nr:IS4 family transposase [Ancylomarina sp. 16SWW S1-10-2]MRT92038.1 IS4 family transposase [Ancylomarina sp. 16SWW S1-10-2]